MEELIKNYKKAVDAISEEVLSNLKEKYDADFEVKGYQLNIGELESILYIRKKTEGPLFLCKIKEQTISDDYIHVCMMQQLKDIINTAMLQKGIPAVIDIQTPNCNSFNQTEFVLLEDYLATKGTLMISVCFEEGKGSAEDIMKAIKYSIAKYGNKKLVAVYELSGENFLKLQEIKQKEIPVTYVDMNNAIPINKTVKVFE